MSDDFGTEADNVEHDPPLAAASASFSVLQLALLGSEHMWIDGAFPATKATSVIPQWHSYHLSYGGDGRVAGPTAYDMGDATPPPPDQADAVYFDWLATQRSPHEPLPCYMLEDWVKLVKLQAGSRHNGAVGQLSE